MGGSVRDERLRLLVDGSYFDEWSNPGWMYPPCALRDCEAAGCLQYVEYMSHVCNWCQAHALQNYM